jgi:hypothetical protein
MLKRISLRRCPYFRICEITTTAAKEEVAESVMSEFIIAKKLLEDMTGHLIKVRVNND